ncbi:MAG: helix-turn-helix transcriptional regulator [Bacteroidota bacterium]
MKPIHIEQIETLLQLGGKTDLRHPLFHILKVESIRHLPQQFPLDFSFGFYTIGLIRNLKGEVRCGRRAYDFQQGTMFFVGPNQLVGHALNALEDADGWLIFFHRSYLANHSLAEIILQYGFFGYTVNEALHLSQAEESAMEHLLDNIFSEYQNITDQHSRKVVIANLDLLLTYANRYYGRQFITRNDIENHFLVDFDQQLNQYFAEKNLESDGIPAVAYFAEQLNMSPKYLGDKLKVLTGKTAQEHIHLKLMEKAKVLLQQNKHSVSEIAYQLGFEYPQYFSRFFKKREGISPSSFQHMN